MWQQLLLPSLTMLQTPWPLVFLSTLTLRLIPLGFTFNPQGCIARELEFQVCGISSYGLYSQEQDYPLSIQLTKCPEAYPGK